MPLKVCLDLLGMEHSKSYELRDGIFSRTRTLQVTPQYIQFESSDLRRTARLNNNEILDIKYDTGYIYWSIRPTIRIGKKYNISIKGKDRILDIKFKSYFNTKREYSGFYSEIVHALNNFYLKDIVAEYLEKFNKTGEIQLGRIVLNTERIKVQNTGLFFLWPPSWRTPVACATIKIA